MASNKIIIKGAKEHNLKNIDLEIPRDKLVVFTGLSGSGKSSLAFDTIYAEGQRRYVESLSSYARMFLGQMEKPNVDYIDGLSPAISIDQKTTSKNPRSTVGTVTEIYDYLRLLYARIGIPHCPICGREISKQSVDVIVDKVMALDGGTKIQILAPVVKGRKGEHQKELDSARKSGFVRVRIDGNLYDLSEDIKLEKNIKYNIEIVVDRLVINDDMAEAVEDAFRYDRLVLCACTYDGGIFPPMEDFLHHLKAKAYQNRKIAFVENGSWAPTAARQMKAIVEGFKNIECVEPVVTIKSTLNEASEKQMDELVAALTK